MIEQSQPKTSDESAELTRWLAEHRERLRRMVSLRLDRRLSGRVDASDVIQEAFVEAALRYRQYKDQREVPPYLWLRFLTGQKLAQTHRKHLGVKARDAGREVSLYRGPMPEASTQALAAHLIGKQTSPTQAAHRAELQLRVQQALNAMAEIDREVLSLRHFEQLSNAESAMLLNLSEAACYKRYARALQKLSAVLQPQTNS